MSSKVAAMERIARETDGSGGSPFPRFMLENMRAWEREGLITIIGDDGDKLAVITAAGRKLAKKGNINAK